MPRRVTCATCRSLFGARSEVTHRVFTLRPGAEKRENRVPGNQSGPAKGMDMSSIKRGTRLRVLAVVVAVLAGMVVSTLGTAAPAAAYSWTRTLQKGMSGADVKELQIRVAGFAASSPSSTYVAVDGQFGEGTYQAVRRFQSAYGLSPDGIVGPLTQAKLNSLESSDGSTLHFDWTEFDSRDCSCFSGGNVSTATVRENVRRLMWKLEALRVKLGSVPVTVNSGFRTIAYNNTLPGAAENSMHTYGVAADITVPGKSLTTVYNTARTCGFSGIKNYWGSGFTHMDSRMEYPYGSQYWWLVP